MPPSGCSPTGRCAPGWRRMREQRRHSTTGPRSSMRWWPNTGRWSTGGPRVQADFHSIRELAQGEAEALPALPKLIIQIPCLNEEATISETLSHLPRQLPGIGAIEWLIINDGSTDRTVEVARAAGADHVVEL